MRSLCNETVKITEISTFMCDQLMDIVLITETWLKTHGDEGRLHDMTPAGYIAKSFPRESRRGGIAVVYNKCLSKRISITVTFSFHHQSFQVIRLSIIIIIIILVIFKCYFSGELIALSLKNIYIYKKKTTTTV